MSANTDLVQLLKNGKCRVTKKDLKEKYGSGKSVIVRETQNSPKVLERYRRDKNLSSQPPLSHIALAESEGTQPPDWDSLLGQLLAVEPGKEHFSKYEDAIEQLLSAIFYPSLVNPQKQTELHDGRKRIDLTYTNAAQSGFFHWLGQHYPAAHIFIECKNYSREIANPELDQLAGRFSPSRGKFGIITCRSFENKELFLKRCCDTANDDRGYIIPFDDSDISALVNEIQAPEYLSNTYALLQRKFHRLMSMK